MDSNQLFEEMDNITKENIYKSVDSFKNHDKSDLLWFVFFIIILFEHDYKRSMKILEEEFPERCAEIMQKFEEIKNNK